ncbi:MAG: tRNA lysidine(34) synthetase TilS [Verrucomicrobiota bacterium JB025]|nr:tRNA lysidine(34) synthetase TilS [Verrucomicrobiota bacterium JB025]
MPIEQRVAWLGSAPGNARWLVGVSGGADSVALLHLLAGAGFRKLVVCHLNHGLRGRASVEDAKFVKRLAASLGVECELGRADVGARMKRRGESLETAARNERMEFFGGCARKWRCRRVLLAHHMDDQAETVLWNLLRGSRGLKGMREVSGMELEDGMELELVRPLLGIRHAELVAWLEARKLRWREDASNGEPVGVRNRLRNEVLPLLDEVSGRDAVAAFCRGAADAAELEAFECEVLEGVRMLDPQGRIHLPTFRGLPVVLQRRAMRSFLMDHRVADVDRCLLEHAVGLADVERAAVVNLPGGRRLRRTGGRIWID